MLGSKAVAFMTNPKVAAADRQRFLSIEALHHYFANTSATYQGKLVTWSKIWLRHPSRRQYLGVEFHPDPKSEPSGSGYLNLWRGFAVPPAPNPDWRRYKTFRDHLVTNVCNGDKAVFNWVFAFFAHIAQRPRERRGVALVLRGGQGAGKTVVGEIIGKLFPDHYFLVDDPRYVTGNFNAHMATCLLLQADEAVWAGDKAAEGRLKGLVTSPFQQIEAKGIDPIQLPNYVRLIMTSNEDWVVPAGKDERRFCVLDVNERCKQNREYFRDMHAEIMDGGLAHLLGDLLRFDLESVDPQIPLTGALLEQKFFALDSVGSWWHGRLERGEITRHVLRWPEPPDFISAALLFDDYVGAAEKIGVRRKREETAFGIKLRKLCPKIKRVRRRDPELTWCYELPPLKQARESFEQQLHQRIEWPDGDMVDEAEVRNDDVEF